MADERDADRLDANRLNHDRAHPDRMSRLDEPARVFSLAEVARHLNVSPDGLQRLRSRFAHVLGPGAAASDPVFTTSDIAALVTVQKLLAQGYDDTQIEEHLTPEPLPAPKEDETLTFMPVERLSATLRGDEGGVPQAVGDVLHALATGQQAVLNGQSSLREMINVVVQDNFNLKDENRKLRERMLEMERVLAEYQRREETRKERLEGRLRGLESTVAALQQQVSQLIQIQRRQQQRRGWFG